MLKVIVRSIIVDVVERAIHFALVIHVQYTLRVVALGRANLRTVCNQLLWRGCKEKKARKNGIFRITLVLVSSHNGLLEGVTWNPRQLCFSLLKEIQSPLNNEQSDGGGHRRCFIGWRQIELLTHDFGELPAKEKQIMSNSKVVEIQNLNL